MHKTCSVRFFCLVYAEAAKDEELLQEKKKYVALWLERFIKRETRTRCRLWSVWLCPNLVGYLICLCIPLPVSAAVLLLWCFHTRQDSWKNIKNLCLMQHEGRAAEVGLKCFSASPCLISEYHWSVAGVEGEQGQHGFNKLFSTCLQEVLAN